MIDRRRMLAGLAGSGLLLAHRAAHAKAAETEGAKFAAAMRLIESGSGGRLGVAVLDRADGRRWSWRPDELFPVCSTFKFLLAAAVLARAEHGQERLDRQVPVRSSDIVSNSPFVEKRVGGTASVAELCEATMIWSDNAAANLLLPSIGGPPGITAFARGLGDRVTRLDRNEPSLGEARPGDPRDTTAPRAMLGCMEQLLLGTTLKPASIKRLAGWLFDNRTGNARLRAGLPDGWRVGDKTGSGLNGTANDIAIAWPLGRPPVLIASYLTGSSLEGDALNAVHARVAREVVATVEA